MKIVDLTEEQAEDIEERLSAFDESHITYKMDGCVRIGMEENGRLIAGLDACMALIDRLAIDAYEHDGNSRVAQAYDSGTGRGYIGFSESMRLLENRMGMTWIKAVSFSDGENIPRVYMDAAAITSGTEGLRYRKCLELINVMAEANVLTALSVREGRPQYLLLARRTPYRYLADLFPIYAQLEKLAGDENNRVMLVR